jgi:predicted ATPase
MAELPGPTGSHDHGLVSTLPLYGREAELGVVEELLDGVPEHGGALVVRGDAGIGKSSLTAAAIGTAGARGMGVSRTVGVESEAQLPFAGLHQLLQPILGGLSELPGPQRAALKAAFGIADADAPDRFLIALATLDLLGDAAASSPLLLVAEDAHWLDRSTADVLAFVARRVSVEPIVVLLSVREGLRKPAPERPTVASGSGA